MSSTNGPAVHCVAEQNLDEIRFLLGRYGIQLVLVADSETITASYWGAPEAGIVGNRVYVRGDTPIHSLLHESAHIICMSSARRQNLNRDAGGGDLEESGVCYLQIVLADYLTDVGRARLMQDMDAWGYSFRLGNTKRWFEEDATDAIEWLKRNALLTADGQPSWTLMP